jgi:rhamnosyltransferase
MNYRNEELKIACILVTYNPNITILKQAISSIIDQVDILIIVDNSTNNIALRELVPIRVSILKMNANIGIAAAQNNGIKFLISNGITHVLFLDQDSIVPSNLVALLLSDLSFLQNAKNIHVGAIGPSITSRSNNRKYPVKSMSTFNDMNIIEVKQLISSASLVPVENFTKVGLMDELLFIDTVDHEWCWRAAYKAQLRFFISENITLEHLVGDSTIDLGFFKLIKCTPFRSYYVTRNTIILLFRAYVPWKWKISSSVKMIARMVLFPVCYKPRYQYLIKITKGILDGFKIAFNDSKQ